MKIFERMSSYESIDVPKFCMGFPLKSKGMTSRCGLSWMQHMVLVARRGTYRDHYILQLLQTHLIRGGSMAVHIIIWDIISMGICSIAAYNIHRGWASRAPGNSSWKDSVSILIQGLWKVCYYRDLHEASGCCKSAQNTCGGQRKSTAGHAEAD